MKFHENPSSESRCSMRINMTKLLAILPSRLETKYGYSSLQYSRHPAKRCFIWRFDQVFCLLVLLTGVGLRWIWSETEK